LQLAQACLQRGLAQQQAGDLAMAAQAYQEALRLVPDHPTALQLLGLVARREGNLPQAEALMRRSLAREPRQPHVWNNLGNVLEDSGQLQPALDCVDQALALEPNYADAHYNRARLLQGLNQTQAAALALARMQALAAAPTPSVLQLQALIEADLGRLDDALVTMQQALQMAPKAAALHHDHATLLQRAGRHVDALAAHQQAQALGLDVADAHYNHGNTLQSLGRQEEAMAAYRRALERQPGHALALYDLARLRWRRADPDFDEELRDAAAADTGSTAATSLRAQLLLQAGRTQDAAAAFADAMARAPNQAGLHSGLARCLARSGDMHRALREHARAAALAPEDATVLACRVAALLQALQPDAASAAVQSALLKWPQDPYLLALQGLVWRLQGDPREAWLNDHDHLIGVIDLPPPESFDTMEAFNAALGAELAHLHRDRAPPLDQTLRHGTQTLGQLFGQGLPMVDALKTQIEKAINGYLAGLRHDSGHPFLARRSSLWRFTDSWSSRLGPGGFHTNHVHPHGWLSSAYYVQVPPVVADPQQRQGWLQFGAPDFDLGLATPAQRLVQPKAGRLVLFPSMLWHGTMPFNDHEPRVTIAFDVVPS
jgi:uncharacterized protein (TIGR02466 family)